MSDSDDDDKPTNSSVKRLSFAAAKNDLEKLEKELNENDSEMNGCWTPEYGDWKYGDIEDWQGAWRSPLHYALQCRHPRITRALLSRDAATLTQVDFDGNSPLQIGCMFGCTEGVRMVLADRRCTPELVNLKNKEGKNALQMALMSGNGGCAAAVALFKGADLGEAGDNLLEIANEAAADYDAVVAENGNYEQEQKELEEKYKEDVKNLEEKHKSKLEELKDEEKRKVESMKTLLNL